MSFYIPVQTWRFCFVRKPPSWTQWAVLCGLLLFWIAFFSSFTLLHCCWMGVWFSITEWRLVYVCCIRAGRLAGLVGWWPWWHIQVAAMMFALQTVDQPLGSICGISEIAQGFFDLFCNFNIIYFALHRIILCKFICYNNISVDAAHFSNFLEILNSCVFLMTWKEYLS